MHSLYAYSCSPVTQKAIARCFCPSAVFGNSGRRQPLVRAMALQRADTFKLLQYEYTPNILELRGPYREGHLKAAKAMQVACSGMRCFLPCLVEFRRLLIDVLVSSESNRAERATAVYRVVHWPNKMLASMLCRSRESLSWPGPLVTLFPADCLFSRTVKRKRLSSTRSRTRTSRMA